MERGFDFGRKLDVGSDGDIDALDCDRVVRSLALEERDEAALPRLGRPSFGVGDSEPGFTRETIDQNDFAVGQLRRQRTHADDRWNAKGSRENRGVTAPRAELGDEPDSRGREQANRVGRCEVSSDQHDGGVGWRLDLRVAAQVSE